MNMMTQKLHFLNWRLFRLILEWDIHELVPIRQFVIFNTFYVMHKDTRYYADVYFASFAVLLDDHLLLIVCSVFGLQFKTLEHSFNEKSINSCFSVVCFGKWEIPFTLIQTNSKTHLITTTTFKFCY